MKALFTTMIVSISLLLTDTTFAKQSNMEQSNMDCTVSNFQNSVWYNEYKELKKFISDCKNFNLDGPYYGITAETAVMYVSDRGYLEKLKILVNAGADVNIANSLNGTALMNAANAGHVEILKYLIKNGAKVNAEGKKQQMTALILAILSKSIEAVKILVNAGADVNLLDKLSSSPLHFAKKSEAITHFLIQAGANVNSCDAIETPLIAAVIWSKDGGSVRALLEAGANPNKTCGGFNTALIELVTSMFVNHDSFFIASLLRQHGADINQKGTKGRTAVYFSAWRRHPNLKMLRFLIHSGANVNIATRSKETPLMVASRKGHENVVYELLKVPGINVNAKNNKGETALSLTNSAEIANALINAGAK